MAIQTDFSFISPPEPGDDGEYTLVTVRAYEDPHYPIQVGWSFYAFQKNAESDLITAQTRKSWSPDSAILLNRADAIRLAHALVSAIGADREKESGDE